MTAAASAQTQPPEAELQFDIGSTDDSLERMIELFARLGDIYRVFVPARGSYTYVIHHPDDVKRVLLSNHRNYTKGVGLDRVRILLGKGIMTSEGELWKRQRYMMQPFFHRRVLTEFAAIIATANERFIERWQALARRGELVNLTDEMSELTLEIVLRSIFGRDLDRLTQQLGGNPFEVVTKEQSRDLQFAYRFRSLTKIVAQLIAQRRAERQEHFDYLAMLMSARDKESGAPMGERELIDEVLTLIVAGHETTASGLNLPWYLLSQHPAVQARLHAELDAAPPPRAPPPCRPQDLRRWKRSRTRNGSSTRRCACIRPDGCCRAVPSRRTCSAAIRYRRAPTCCCRCTCCIVTRASGRTRKSSGPSVSPPRTRPSGRASPTCPSPPARAIASARPSLSTRCSCTCTRSRATIASATCPTGPSSSRRRSTCAPAIRST